MVAMMCFRLQATTSVYTKKVEYLRVLAYETLKNFATSPGAPGKRDGPRSAAKKRSGDDSDSSKYFSVPYNILVSAYGINRNYYNSGD